MKLGGMALSVGVVWWASRISGLLGSLLASAPAWRHIDPLPVVGRDDDDDEKKDWYDGRPRRRCERAGSLRGPGGLASHERCLRLTMMRLFRLGPVSRISLGLVSLAACLLLMADLLLGLLPDQADVAAHVRKRSHRERWPSSLPRWCSTSTST